MTLPPWYTPKYCEENVWRLLQEPGLAAEERHAVFISNARKAVPMWLQRASEDPAEPVCWDYHVVMLGMEQRPMVYDLDCRLPLPVELGVWIAGSFPQVAPGFEPCFRVIPAAQFLATFASDRSHMRTEDGGWQAPPPPFPPITAGEERMNLWRFVDMSEPFVGEVLDLAGLVRWRPSRR